MMAVLERLSAQMSQLQSEIEASKGRYAAELRSQVRNQDLIIGLLRHGSSHCRSSVALA